MLQKKTYRLINLSFISNNGDITRRKTSIRCLACGSLEGHDDCLRRFELPCIYGIPLLKHFITFSFHKISSTSFWGCISC